MGLLDAQPDLFGNSAPAQPVYVVPYPIAVNTLKKTLEALTAAKRWPWDPDMKAARMERNVPKMLAVLPDDEAGHWRALIAAEAARLDAAG
ncbi:hypothetical protein GVN24_34760 [Rhizobium sp. CRIBSB]|nr:hypothetical protein [Rhizobium sp. CRIBSB]